MSTERKFRIIGGRGTMGDVAAAISRVKSASVPASARLLIPALWGGSVVSN
jgi:hypothetical protein